MKDAGFVVGSWVVTFVSVAGYAAWVLRRARRAARGSDRSGMPWT